MLQLATAQDLARLHDVLYTNLQRYGRDIGPRLWGWPSGSEQLEVTYLFTLEQGILLLGSWDLDNRWWLGVDLRDEYPQDQLSPKFEFNIPKAPTRNLSVVFVRRGNLIEVLHKGKFTVGRGSISRDLFFDYYTNYPAHWPIVSDNGVRYLILFVFDLDHFYYRQFFSFLTTLAYFSDYVTWYKDQYRR